MKTPEICNCNKMRLQCSCFPVKFTKFLRKLFSQNTSRRSWNYDTNYSSYYSSMGRLLLDLFNQLTIFYHPVNSETPGFFDFWTCFIKAFKTSLSEKKTTQLLLHGNTHLSETLGGIKRCFFRLINWWTFIYILIEFCTPLSCIILH